VRAIRKGRPQSFSESIEAEQKGDAQLEKVLIEFEAPPERERSLCASARKKSLLNKPLL